MKNVKKRCGWVTDDPLYIEYHDREWGVPCFDDRKLFELLILEGAQAGLSWITVLKKREHYRRTFDNFDAGKIAEYDHEKVAELLSDQGIIRNKLKLAAAIQNAEAFLRVEEEYGSFATYIWQFVGGKPINNTWKKSAEIPTKTRESGAMSKDLLKRGFKFVGPTICYAYMQAAGLVNDHLIDCFRYHEVDKK